MSNELEPLSSSSQLIEIFGIYAHEDQELHSNIETQLKSLERQGIVKYWHYGLVPPGGEARKEIEHHLKTAQVVLSFMSPYSIQSADCFNLMEQAMELYDAKTVCVIPIILRSCLWQYSPINQLQPLPRNEIPIAQWPDQTQASFTVVQEIQKLIANLQLKTKQFPEDDHSRMPQTAQFESPDCSSFDRNPAVLQPIKNEPVRGWVPLDSPFYLQRKNRQTDPETIEERCYQAIQVPGYPVRIRAASQMGKTSLVRRILSYANDLNYQTAFIDFHEQNRDSFHEINTFLQRFCYNLSDKFNLPNQAELREKSSFINDKPSCIEYFQRHFLPSFNTNIVLGLDEVEFIFQKPEVGNEFFSLLRSWSERSRENTVWKKLRLVIAYSARIRYQLDYQSPFNVDLPIDLKEFTQYQIRELMQRYGLALTDSELENLKDLVGGHPHLLRLTFSEARNAMYAGKTFKQALEDLCNDSLVNQGLYYEHLYYHWRALEADPNLKELLKRIIATHSILQGADLEYGGVLRDMGLIRFENSKGKVSLQCELYRKYFEYRL